MTEPETVARTASAGLVEVQVGAVAAQVPILRTVAADIAMREDLELDAIDDLRMAVDEACSLLVSIATPEARLTCVFLPSEQEITITAEVRSRRDRADFKEAMGWQVLSALTDEVTDHVEEAGEDDLVRIELVRRRGEQANR
ncbi:MULTISPECIES: hypothetical protein [Actinoalloteichus]|uniref:Histidine kinase-like ATPase domain n=1 Tax=Actinoalloteichus fjordicus TaxID=1612552 RepID=A0AAC9PU08_9PSEU|nr:MULTISPECIES: hypothetical protein [Actinoalloteichus]APU16703.1 Histidine kinase-like ATPase domain [Actinoalloteichus fjordicus]APU22769.1 Histidine kinase-like ATPase domain [Actinoalloteichus sp. GBA129-24]